MSSSGSVRVLLVDGHSVIFAWPDLRSLHARRTALAREELAGRLQAYQDVSGEQIVVVFDGSGAETTSERADEHSIQVIYSEKGRTADDVIERLVAQYSEQYELTVVTADRAEQETVAAFGALCASPRTLREKLDSAGKELQGSLLRLRKRGEQRR